MLETTDYAGITQIKMGRELDGAVLYWVAAYLVDGLLIDTGCKHTAEELLEYLQDRKVRDVVVTHYHEDHIGGNSLLQQKLTAKIWAHSRTISLINSDLQLYPYQELVWGYPEPSTVQALPGDEIRTDKYCFQVVETPGHSADHVVLIEQSRGWCFSGDLFVSERIKVLRPEEEIKTIMRSMQKLVDRGDDLTLFTSIGKIVPEGRKALVSCLDYLDKLEHEVKLLHEEGLSEYQILDRVFGGESSMADLTNGQFACINLIYSLLKCVSV